MRRLLFVLLLAASGACSDKEEVVLQPASLVDKLRVLAIKAEPPEAAPGQMVSLTALVADPLEKLRNTGHLWVMCDPSVDGEFGNACAQTDTLRSFDIEELPPGVNVFPLFFNFAFYRAPWGLLDQLEEEERRRGMTATVLLVAWEGGTQEHLQDPSVLKQLAIKRIRIADPQEEPNRNPVLQSVTLDGQPFEESDAPQVRAGTTITLSASSTEDSVQVFERVLPDGSVVEQSEQNVFSWYTTGGRFTQGLEYSSRTESGKPIGLELPALGTLPDDRLDVWVVLRDARGGTDWARRTLQLVP